MKIKILSPLWGHEQVPLPNFLEKISHAGYDGIDTWLPDQLKDQRILFNYLDHKEMYLVAHQHAASGSTFKKFRKSFADQLEKCLAGNPLLINSHTGKDYFSMAENLELIDIAAEFSARWGVTVLHETHRGRMGYSPQSTAGLFKQNADWLITADFSHWVCVTESMLDNFSAIVKEAISRTRHIHARIGFEQGPQVPDPVAPEWKYALDIFLGWWDEIVEINRKKGRAILTITTEFGPPPYMPVIPFSNLPIANQFAVNCQLKELLRHRYEKYI